MEAAAALAGRRSRSLRDSSAVEQHGHRIGILAAQQLAHQDAIVVRDGEVAVADGFELHHPRGADVEEERAAGDADLVAAVDVRLDLIAVRIHEKHRAAVRRPLRLDAAGGGDANLFSRAPEWPDVDLTAARLVG